MPFGVGVKVGHVHPERDAVKRLGDGGEKLKLLRAGPLGGVDVFHRTAFLVRVPQNVFERFLFALGRRDAGAGQKCKSKRFLQAAGRFVESIASALDKIHLFYAEKLVDDGPKRFGGIALALRLPADAEGERLPLLPGQRFQRSEKSRHGRDVQVSDEPPAGFFKNAVTARLFVFEPVEVLADVGFGVKERTAHHPGHFVVHRIGGVVCKIGFFQSTEEQPLRLNKNAAHAFGSLLLSSASNCFKICGSLSLMTLPER